MEIKCASLFQAFGLASLLMSYRSEILTNSCKRHILVLLIASLSSHGVGMLFMAGASLIIYYAPSLELLSIAYLTSILSSFTGVAYKKAISLILTCLLQRGLSL